MQVNVSRVSAYEWTIDKSFQKCMNVPVTVFADDVLIDKMKQDLTLKQAANVAAFQEFRNLYSFCRMVIKVMVSL